MYLIAFSPTYEGLDLYSDGLRLLAARGARVEVARIRDAGSPSLLPDFSGSGSTASGETWRHEGNVDLDVLARAIVEADPDVLFHASTHRAEVARLTSGLRGHGYKGLIVAGQDLLGMRCEGGTDWDRQLCFGTKGFLASAAHSSHACGLPRLDRLRGLSTSKGDYGIFLAHRSPEAPIVTATLAAFERASRLPCIVCDHVDYPGLYRPKSLQAPHPQFPSGCAPFSLDLLQHCNFVLATDAVGVLDALYLGKPVVLLPNSGLTAFAGYPGIAEGFSPGAIQEALRRIATNTAGVERFLNETVGGVRYDHAESFCRVVTRLVTSGPLRRIGAADAALLGSRSGQLPRLETRVELVEFMPLGGRAVELGVAKGVFSDEMLRARADIRVTSIDRWSGDRGHDDLEHREASERLCVHGPRSLVLKKTFDEALQDFPPESVDLIYLDGYAHDGQQGGKTLEEWWSRLKVGGIFAGHDYHPDWRPTVEAVDNFCKLRGLAVQTTSGDFFPSWYVRKARTEVVDSS